MKWIYAITALVFLIIGFVIPGSFEIIDHETFYVVAKSHLLFILAIVYFFFALTLWGISRINRRLSNVLNWIHYLGTMICIIVVSIFMNNVSHKPNTFSDYSVLIELETFENQDITIEWISAFIAVLILFQLVFIGNVIRAFLIKK